MGFVPIRIGFVLVCNWICSDVKLDLIHYKIRLLLMSKRHGIEKDSMYRLIVMV